MIVVAVGHQHDVDRRQIRKRDTRIVHAFGADRAERRSALRPDGIKQNVEAAGLNEKAGVAHIANADVRAFDPRRRTVGKGKRRPGRPLCPGAAPLAIDDPAQQIPAAARRRAQRIEKPLAGEMGGNRTLVIARLVMAWHGGALYSVMAPAPGGAAAVDGGRVYTYFPPALARDRFYRPADQP